MQEPQPSFDPSLLTILGYVGYWYLIGMIFLGICSIIWIMDGEIEEIRVNDFERFFGWSMLGPFLGLLMSYMLFMKLTTGFRQVYAANKNKVLWRSRTSQAKAVLYGSKDDDDD